ncbi:TPA: hypothetical protein RMI67_005515 [Bacillus cereus]|nr:hypothetical protein [Bacillus cereus]
MKKQFVALTAVITLVVPLPTVALAHENIQENNRHMIQYWSAEDKYLEGINSHLWIVNRAMDICKGGTPILFGFGVSCFPSLDADVCRASLREILNS